MHCHREREALKLAAMQPSSHQEADRRLGSLERELNQERLVVQQERQSRIGAEECRHHEASSRPSETINSCCLDLMMRRWGRTSTNRIEMDLSHSHNLTNNNTTIMIVPNLQSNATQRTNNIVDVFEEVIVIDCNRPTSRERERESGGLDRYLSHTSSSSMMIEEEIEQRSRGFVLVLPLATHRRGARSLSRGSHTPTRPRPPAVLLVITLTLSLSLSLHLSLLVAGWLAAAGWRSARSLSLACSSSAAAASLALCSCSLILLCLFEWVSE